MLVACTIEVSSMFTWVILIGEKKALLYGEPGFSYGQVRAQAEGETRPSKCEAENATRGNRYALGGP